MKMSRIVGCVGMLLGLAGCGTTPSSIVQQPTTARPQALPTQAAGNGAIYQVASYTPMFEDRRARHVGDVLTIVINEKTQAGKKASSNGAKTGAVDSSISAVAGLPLKTFQGAGVKADSSTSYDDKSAIDSSNLFTGNITVTVTEVLPNGNLVVAGEKQIALDKTAPDTLRRRARQMAGLLGQDAVEDPKTATGELDGDAAQAATPAPQ